MPWQMTKSVIFAVCFPVNLFFSETYGLFEIELDDFHVLRLIENPVRKELFSDDANTPKSEAQDPSDKGQNPYQHKNSDNQVADIVPGIEFRGLVPGDIGVIIY